MSGLFGSTTIKGTRLTDFSSARVSVGDPIAFGYGSFPVDGQVIFAPLPPKEHYSKKRQGKGGVKQEVYTYTLSYAVAFALGPIYGFKWIKRNGKVVYTTDPNSPLEDRSYATKWAQRVSFYFGFPDQMPDSIMESYEGTGNVSAHRKLCFIVVEDDDVTDQGGAVPSYEACVVASPPDVYVTSKPYPLVTVEDVMVSSQSRLSYFFSPPVDEVSVGSQALDGDLREVIQSYQNYEVEAVNVSGMALNSAGVKTVLLSYNNYPYEAANVFSTALDSPGIADVLLSYLNYQPEGANISSTALNGSLS